MYTNQFKIKIKIPFQEMASINEQGFGKPQEYKGKGKGQGFSEGLEVF